MSRVHGTLYVGIGNCRSHAVSLGCRPSADSCPFLLMPTSRVLLIAGCCLALGGRLLAQSASILEALPPDDSFRVDSELANAAYAAAGADDVSATDRSLAAPADPQASRTGVELARRAVMVCGWLQNDNCYGRAQKIARRALAFLARIDLPQRADLVERLYWEAWLHGKVLDEKATAVAQLEQARAIAPDDPRILDLDLELTAALVAAADAATPAQE